MAEAITLQQLNRRIAGLLADSTIKNVWVVAEVSDLRTSRGHCYMELNEKDPDSGSPLARMRAIIWQSTYVQLSNDFFRATGRRLADGMKVMVCGSVNYNAAYGISFIISAIDPTFTLGEAERRRREILMRLQREGLLELNRSIEWADVVWRIAVISAPGAAGYGDFINQLYHNASHLRFRTGLFEAVMQGDRTVPTIIAALDRIVAEIDDWDCVVIIRGGGATSDLTSFDDYTLAANVAQFPLPIITGIGHERDTTVLDYVSALRVKTPTAAAEWLIARGEAELERLRQLASDMLQTISDRISGCQTQLAYIDSALTTAPKAAVQRAETRLQRATTQLAGISARRLAPEQARIEHTMQAIITAGRTALARANDRIRSHSALLEALSPQATIRRGYSITTYQGRAIRSIADIPAGAQIQTTIADGTFTSTINQITNKK